MYPSALLIYKKTLGIIVVALMFIMALTLVGSLIGLVFDCMGAISAIRQGIPTHSLSHGLIDSVARDLVIDVLSVLVLIELFRTFTDYLEYQYIRVWVLTEVGIAFVLRDIFIGLYSRSMDWAQTLALTALLAVLVGARLASKSHAGDS